MSRYRTLLHNEHCLRNFDPIIYIYIAIEISRFYKTLLINTLINSISRKKETDCIPPAYDSDSTKGSNQRDDPLPNASLLRFPLSLYSLEQRRGVQRNTDKFHEFIIEHANRIPHRVVISAGNTADIIPTIISSPWLEIARDLLPFLVTMAFHVSSEQRREEGQALAIQGSTSRENAGERVWWKQRGSGNGRKEKATVWLGTNDSLKDDRILL